MNDLDTLMLSAKACRECEAVLPHGIRPVFQTNAKARILVAGQAPGRKVHATGVLFDDASGDRLRSWMGVSSRVFYDPSQIAILPMGFCYPGTGKSGDLPPRPECAAKWRQRFMEAMPNIGLTLVVGTYAANWHLGDRQEKTLTGTVQKWEDFLSDGLLPLPHPSPRNNIWLKKNGWFEEQVLPVLQERIAVLLKR